MNQPTTTKLWPTEVSDLLARAAELCVEHGMDVETFMHDAWSAYVDTRPGMREYLEEMLLRNQLDELRKAGRIADA
jgi:hypothetical protein